MWFYLISEFSDRFSFFETTGKIGKRRQRKASGQLLSVCVCVSVCAGPPPFCHFADLVAPSASSSLLDFYGLVH